MTFLRRMTMKRLPFLICVIFFAAALAAHAADDPKAKTKDWNKIYDSVLQRVKNYDSTVDFRDFRLTYARTTRYNPYHDPGQGWRDSLTIGRRTEDYDKMIKYGSLILDSNFVDLGSHMALGYAYYRRGDTVKFQYERWITRELVNSINLAGNGKNFATAYHVISVDEEHTMIGLMGLRILQQTLVTDSGHSYDRYELETSDGQQVILFFNIDVAIDWVKNNPKMQKAG